MADDDDGIPNKGVEFMYRVLEKHQISLHELGDDPGFTEPIRDNMIWLTESGRINFRPG